MYYPIQIPYILNKTFANHVQYREFSSEECRDFVLCFWQMKPLSDNNLSLSNIIVTDACIDIVANYGQKTIGFTGMSKTEFDFTIKMPSFFTGARLAPGAFHQLTKLPASVAMDTFLPLNAVFKNFDETLFFSIPFEQSINYLKTYLSEVINQSKPDKMTTLFHALSEQPVSMAQELCDILYFSARKCERVFMKHFGITPKKALNIVRFQTCLQDLISSQNLSVDMQNIQGYYDQPHMIKDFKRHLGITPLELIRYYQS